MGRLMPGPASSMPNPLEDIGSGELNGGVGLGPKVPTLMIFFCYYIRMIYFPWRNC